MRATRRRMFVLIVVFCALAALVAAAYVWKQNPDQTYTNQKYSFQLELLKDQFSVQQNADESGAEILFIDKEIQDQYPEWGGTVFTVFIYTKDTVQQNPLDGLDGPSYLAENDQYYYGYRMPTDVNYPPSEPDVVERYNELSRYAQGHALNSFALLNA